MAKENAPIRIVYALGRALAWTGVKIWDGCKWTFTTLIYEGEKSDLSPWHQATPEQVIQGLDNVVTRVQFQITQLDDHIDELETRDSELVKEVRAGKLSKRQKRRVLTKVADTRRKIDALTRRVAILETQASIRTKMIEKIEDTRATKIDGITDADINQILTNFDQALVNIDDADTTAEMLDDSVLPDAHLKREDELAKLEAEILAEGEDETSTPLSESVGESPKPDPLAEGELTDLEKMVEKEIGEIEE